MIYKIWKDGFSLFDQKYYSCDHPLKLKKKDLLKRSDYLLRRFFDLEFAPEDYLLDNGYKPLTNE